jgi:hypothetical protein
MRFSNLELGCCRSPLGALIFSVVLHIFVGLCFCHRKAATHRVWPKGFGKLQSLGLSFELQAKPSQLLSFASAYGKLPSAPDVIIDTCTPPHLQQL